MQKIKHSKYRNAALLFELLNRQIAVDLFNDSKDSRAIALIREHFSADTELGKEYALYQALLGERYRSRDKAEALIEQVMKQRRRLDDSKLERQKYDLVGKIKESYPFDDFFQTRVDSYREMASVYKMFTALKEDIEYRPQDLVECKYTLLEHMQKDESESTDSTLLEGVKRDLKEHAEENRAIRAMAQRLMIERFNEKYGSLSRSQKDLLRRYINNVSNTNGLKEHVDRELDRVDAKLEELQDLVESEVARIKVGQARQMIPELKGGHRVTEAQVQGLLMFYELVERIKDTSRG
jgi:hypothetical protein